MYKNFLSIAATLAALGGVAHAQLQRRAVMTGGGNGDRGKCTVEVVVDGAAEVEIRGDEGTLRNLSGQPPQFRRFQCTGLMPSNPANFRFSGVDGRGHQELVRDPRNGGVAVIRIEDTGGGAEGYTFDLTWGGGEPSRGIQDPGPSSYPGGQVPVRQYPGEQDRNR